MDAIGAAAAVLGGSVAIDAAKKIVGPVADQVGKTAALAAQALLEPLNQRLHEHLERSSARLVEGAARILVERGVDPMLLLEAPPDVVAAVSLSSAAASDAEQVQALFAGLLATAAQNKSGDRPHPAIAETLRQLSPMDAVLLELLWRYNTLATEGSASAVSFQRTDGRRVVRESPQMLSDASLAGREDLASLSQSVIVLERLGLVARVVWTQETRVGDLMTAPRARREIELTQFGEQLLRASLGLRKPSVA